MKKILVELMAYVINKFLVEDGTGILLLETGNVLLME